MLCFVICALSSFIWTQNFFVMFNFLRTSKSKGSPFICFFMIQKIWNYLSQRAFCQCFLQKRTILGSSSKIIQERSTKKSWCCCVAFSVPNRFTWAININQTAISTALVDFTQGMHNMYFASYQYAMNINSWCHLNMFCESSSSCPWPCPWWFPAWDFSWAALPPPDDKIRIFTFR